MDSQTEYVTDYMRKQIETFSPDMDVREAIQTMLHKKLSDVPVINDNESLVGVLSDIDCVTLLVDGHYFQRPTSKGKVEDFMSTQIRYLRSDMTMLEAAHKFAHSKYNQFPVLEEGKLVGQINRQDVLRAIYKMPPTVSRTPSTWKARIPLMFF